MYKEQNIKYEHAETCLWVQHPGGRRTRIATSLRPSWLIERIEASLVYTESSRPPRALEWNPDLKKTGEYYTNKTQHQSELKAKRCHMWNWKNASVQLVNKEIVFTIVTNNMNYLGVTLTKEVKDLYDKNFKSLKKSKKISEDGKVSHDRGLAGSI